MRKARFLRIMFVQIAALCKNALIGLKVLTRQLSNGKAVEKFDK